MNDLSGRVALVTGAATKRGMGRAIALRLAREGADLALIDLPPDQFQLTEDDRIEGWKGLESLAEEVQAQGRQALAIFADITDSQQVGQAVAKALDRFGKIDILVNNAGIVGGRVPVIESDEREWARIIAVNLTGPYLLSKAVARHMIERGQGGKIVNIASVAGRVALRDGMGPYTASKFGLIGLTQTLAIELGPYKVNVNAVCPGSIATDMGLGRRIRSQMRNLGLSLEEATARAYAKRLPSIPLRRAGQPEDVADLVAFLASKQSDYLTGLAIDIDGGQYMSK